MEFSHGLPTSPAGSNRPRGGPGARGSGWSRTAGRTAGFVPGVRSRGAGGGAKFLAVSWTTRNPTLGISTAGSRPPFGRREAELNRLWFKGQAAPDWAARRSCSRGRMDPRGAFGLPIPSRQMRINVWGKGIVLESRFPPSGRPPRESFSPGRAGRFGRFSLGHEVLPNRSVLARDGGESLRARRSVRPSVWASAPGGAAWRRQRGPVHRVDATHSKRSSFRIKAQNTSFSYGRFTTSSASMPPSSIRKPPRAGPSTDFEVKGSRASTTANPGSRDKHPEREPRTFVNKLDAQFLDHQVQKSSRSRRPRPRRRTQVPGD